MCKVTGMVRREELNGKDAEIVGFDESSGRCHADIAGVGRASLQPTNLLLPAGARGKVHGLTSDAGSKWNEKVGKVLSFDEASGRYLLQMTADNELRIKPANLAL